MSGEFCRSEMVHLVSSPVVFVRLSGIAGPAEQVAGRADPAASGRRVDKEQSKENGKFHGDRV